MLYIARTYIYRGWFTLWHDGVSTDTGQIKLFFSTKCLQKGCKVSRNWTMVATHQWQLKCAQSTENMHVRHIQSFKTCAQNHMSMCAVEMYNSWYLNMWVVYIVLPDKYGVHKLEDN